MRPQEAIDAWREVLELDERDFRALGGPRAAVHAGGALGGVHRRPRAEARSARRADDAGRRAAPGGVGVGRQDRRPRPAARGVRAHPAARPAEHDGVDRARAGLSPAQGGTKLIELLLARVEFTPTRRSADPAAQRGRRDLREADRRSGGRVRRRCRRRSARTTRTTRSRRARAAGDGDQQVERAARRVHAGRAGDHASRSTAADLWVKIGRWYGRAPRATSSTRSPRCSRRCARRRRTPSARGAGRLLSASSRRGRELVATLARHAELERGGAEAGRAPPGAGRAVREASSATRRRRWPRTSGRSTPTEHAWRRSTRSSGSTAARAVGRPDRRPRQEGAGRRRHRGGRSASSTRSASSGRSGSATRRARSRPTRRSCRSIRRTRGAQGARAALREDRRHGEVPRRPRAAARRVARTDDERISLYERMAAAWEEQFRKPDRACEALEKILLIDDRQRARPRRSSGLYRQERSSDALVETLRATSTRSTTDGDARSTSTRRWARSTRRS